LPSPSFINGDYARPVPRDESYLQRAELLADLGQYDEAAAELGFAVAMEPEDGAAWSLLTAVHLAANRPAEALDAADRALAVEPGSLVLLVRRALALIDLRRFGEAARLADAMLAAAPDSAYAQRSGAAILGEARNGQDALNAAWRAVALAPEDAEGHLVLGVVAARLRQYDLAERAYREALRLDEEIADAGGTVGVSRLERRRYAATLELLADVAVVEPAVRAVRDPDRRTAADAVRYLVLYGAGATAIAAVFVACFGAGNPLTGRVLAFVLAVVGAGIVWSYARRLPSGRLRELIATDRSLGLAVYATLAGPAWLLLYTVVGSPWPLVLAIAGAAVAELTIFLRTW
jgi:tetratricopeptide (TPR) repeat protein